MDGWIDTFLITSLRWHFMQCGNNNNNWADNDFKNFSSLSLISLIVN